MAEYRRFIAYFYEYIDGKKQKNAGFVKVELRNGVWRMLLRLTVLPQPSPPIQVYGFVREGEYLLGLLLGTIRPVREVTEEWAFRADAAIGQDRYRLGDLAGLWVESGDGRKFATVWDEEGFAPERFVLELPQAKEGEFSDDSGSVASEREKPAKQRTETAGEAVENPGPETGTADEETEGLKQGTETADEAEAVENPGSEMGTADEKAEDPRQGIEASECEPGLAGVPGKGLDTGTAAVAEVRIEPETEPGAGPDTKQSAPQACDAVGELLCKRAHFQPFADEEIRDCVMILPCDIVRLQQENWKVGRSSFLQHGFYQYRHLLLGVAGDGTYILGVPGIQNPQETYMAQMFGYDRFKVSARRGCGQVFGYWCRKLQQA